MSRFKRSTLLLAALALMGAGCGRGYRTPEVTQTPVAAEVTAAAAPIVDHDVRRPNDLRYRRAITLDNGLEALLISDANLQKSCAALDVAVGSLEDPWEHLGLAHFLEHVLFLGTEKYPDVDEYSRYLSENGGGSNAYTAGTETNYLLEVNHDAFPGALDRFAQFFIGPLFDAEFVEREMNAVHSEHQKNLQNDYWRTRMIQRHLHREGHPRRKFSTGSLETLANTTRQQMIEFYREYYSANVMKLCVMSTMSLDELEPLVRETFAAVPNHDRGPLEYSSEVFDPATMPQLIQVRPVTDARRLTLSFAVPTTTPHYRTKPTRLLGSLIGHEGEGSLLSKLKEEDLATALSAGANNATYVAMFDVTIDLTENGRASIDRVIELFFAYIAMLRDRGLERYYYDEKKTMADISFYYRDHEEGMFTVAGYASQMQEFPALEFERRGALFTEYGPDIFADYLSLVTPENLRATLMAPDVETDTVEEHYGSEYSVAKFSDARVLRWRNATPDPSLHYPAPNPFIPDDLALLGNDPHEEPYRLVDDERGTVWFEQDKTFRLPKARVSLLLQSKNVNASPRNRLLAHMYVQCINEGLNEWNYAVHEAGLDASVSDEWWGIRLSFNGFSQRIPDLMAALSERLAEITISETTFEAIKDRLARTYANNDYAQAFHQLFYEFAIVRQKQAIHRNEYRDLVESVTLDEVREFADSLFERSALEGTAYGNLDPNRLERSLDLVFEATAGAVLPEDERPSRHDDLVIPRGTRHARVFSSKSDNHAWMAYAQFGERDAQREAALRVGSAWMATPFYTEMRTRQQLGYVAFSSKILSSDGPGMYFVIQSDRFPATELASRAHAWLEENVAAMRSMDPELFETLRAAVIRELEEEDKDMAERLSTISFHGHQLDGDFGFEDRVIEATRALALEDVADAFETAFGDEQGAILSFYYDADGAEPSVPAEPVIEDLHAFKRELATFEAPSVPQTH